MDVASAVTPEFWDRLAVLREFVPGLVSSAATAFTLVTGFLLLLLAHGLRRRKLRAWRAVVVLLGISVGLHVLKGLDVEEATVSLVAFAGLVLGRREFFALGDPRTRWRALWVLLGLVSFNMVGGLLLVSLRSGTTVAGADLLSRLRQVVDGLVDLTGPVAIGPAGETERLSVTLTVLGLFTVLLPTYLFFRPIQPVAALSEEDETRIRALLERYGSRDSLGYFGLRRDKSVLWSPSGKACIAYRVVHGVMLASGDPLGDPEAWPGAIRPFLAAAERYAWVPAVMGCSELGGEIWSRESGMEALELGDEAVVEVVDFTLEGRAMRNVRQMVHRVERLGYSCDVRRVRDLTDAERDLIRQQVSAWRAAKVERGFSMALGRFGDPADGDSVVATARRDGTLRALLHFVPWGSDGLSLDLMRRDRGGDPGVNELLIVAALCAAPELGVKRVSLNFAAFRSALERGERFGAGPVTRLWRRLLLFLSRWFQIESLYRFNAKFRPGWQPRYVVYPAARDIPRVALAMLEAEAFLTVPHLPFWGSRHGEKQ